MAIKKSTTTKKTAPVSMTVRKLRVTCYDLLTKNMNRDSKFYDSDCEDIWTATLRKNETELRETIARWSYVPSKREINMNCRFEGLPRVGK